MNLQIRACQLKLKERFIFLGQFYEVKQITDAIYYGDRRNDITGLFGLKSQLFVWLITG